MKHFYVEWNDSKEVNGYRWTVVDAACEYDARIIVHNRLYVPLEDIKIVSEL